MQTLNDCLAILVGRSVITLLQPFFFFFFCGGSLCVRLLAAPTQIEAPQGGRTHAM